MARQFLAPAGAFKDGTVLLEGEEARHLAVVLRLGAGDSILVGDGLGKTYRAVVREASPSRVLAEIREGAEMLAEPSLAVTLAQGLLKGEKMELLIQKGTEMGISGFFPVEAAHSVVHLAGEKGKGRRERWQKVAREAAKQCGRAVVPEVGLPMGLAAALSRLPGDTLILMPWEKERGRGVRQALRPLGSPGAVALLVGPEGGWAKEEVEMAVAAGALTVTLGPRILRAETAALAIAALVLYESGDLGG